MNPTRMGGTGATKAAAPAPVQQENVMNFARNLFSSAPAQQENVVVEEKIEEVFVQPMHSPVQQQENVTVEDIIQPMPTSVVETLPPEPVNMTQQRSASDDSGCSAVTGHNFIIGQLVNCQIDDGEEWKVGIIASISPLHVQFETNGPLCSCRYISPIQMDEYTLETRAHVWNQPFEWTGSGIHYSAILEPGTKVRSLEAVGEFLHIVSPVEGWIDGKHIVAYQPPSAAELNAEVVVQNIIQPTPEVETTNPEELPTLNIYHVPENVSARDLANLCMEHGVTPKKIRKVVCQYGVVAVISFGTHSDAKQIHSLRRLSHVPTCTHMPIQWSEKYLKLNSTQV